MKFRNSIALSLIILLASATTGFSLEILEQEFVKQAAEKSAVDLSKNMVCWKGSTPIFDGNIAANEYKDATHFTWTPDWFESMRTEINSPEDLYFDGWIKHDGEHIYLAFDIRDDVFFAIETDRWHPYQDPNAHMLYERTQGRPWFGDMVEILLYGRMLELKQPTLEMYGDGRGVQFVYNLTKSWKHGLEHPGMLPHGPGRSETCWQNNIRWINDNIIDSRTQLYKNENRYSVEFRIKIEGAIEIAENEFWTEQSKETVIGFNLSVGDVDLESYCTDGRLHHETWWAGKFIRDKNNEPVCWRWGALILTSKQKPDNSKL